MNSLKYNKLEESNYIKLPKIKKKKYPQNTNILIKIFIIKNKITT